jgi:hypothetical protein
MRTGPAEDNLDRLLSDFFRSQIQHPWPPAPMPQRAEPSVMVGLRNSAAAGEPSRTQPTTAQSTSDPSARARYTLAASFAMLLGTCWYLSNGLGTADRAGPAAAPSPRVLGVFPDSSAEKPAPLTELRKDKAEKDAPNDGFAPPKIKLP